jgi:hypothetical protein
VKNKLVQSISILILVLFLSGLTAIPVGAVGLGVGPSPLVIENATPGQSYQKTIYVQSSDTQEDVYTLIVSGDISAWITFYAADDHTKPITQLSIPANGTGFALATINIPADAAPLVYTGQILVTGETVAGATAAGGSSVQIQLPIDVSIQMIGAPVPTATVTTTPTVPAAAIISGQMNLTSLDYVGKPQVGTITKLQAVVRNLTGQPAKSHMVVEVYLNNKLIDTFNSDEFVIPADAAGTGIGNTIYAYYKPLKAGDYTLKGQVISEGLQTQQITTQMKVGGSGTNISTITYVGIAVGALLVIGIGFLVFTRRRKSTQIKRTINN